MDFFSILTLIGGLGLFLYGMDVMGDNLKKLAGGKLEMILSKLTSNNIMGFLLGFFVTAIIQSSSATTVMLVGFVNSGIMKLAQTIGVIQGANVGTTVTAWILSLTGITGDTFILKMFKPTSFTPLLMGIGVIMTMVAKKDKNKDIGGILIGFSVLMFGMNIMSDAMSGLKNSEAFGQMLVMFSNPIMGILAGTILTAIIQSSSASVGILQALALTGAIPYSTAIPIILGQNIGTTITPILSSITGNTESKRVAFACLYIKILGVIIVGAGFYVLNAVFEFDFMNSNISVLAIATIHTLFNVISTVILMPFSKAIEKMTVVTIKKKKNEENTQFDTLDDRFLDIPSFAIDKCRELVCEMAEKTRDLILKSTGLMYNYDKDLVKAIGEGEDAIDMYEDKISTYLVKISSGNLSSKDSKTVTELLHCIGDFERISDHAESITRSMTEVHDKQISFSSEAQKELEVISRAVTDVLVMTTDAFINEDLELAKNVEPLEQVVDKLRNKIKTNHVARLQDGKCSIELGFILSDLLNNFERVADHCSNIAACLLEIAHGSFDVHEYLNELKSGDDEFIKQYREYKKKYVLK